MPATLTREIQDIILGLMKRNPMERLGGGEEGAADIKKHPFFLGINWDDIKNKKVKPPFRKKKVIKMEEIDTD